MIHLVRISRFELERISSRGPKPLVSTIFHHIRIFGSGCGSRNRDYRMKTCRLDRLTNPPFFISFSNLYIYYNIYFLKNQLMRGVPVQSSVSWNSALCYNSI